MKFWQHQEDHVRTCCQICEVICRTTLSHDSNCVIYFSAERADVCFLAYSAQFCQSEIFQTTKHFLFWFHHLQLPLLALSLMSCCVCSVLPSLPNQTLNLKGPLT